MADELFKSEFVKAENGSGVLFEEQLTTVDTPVTCLGREFPSDAARREYFTEELRKKLRDPEFRKIEGFPIGEDEDILALSDPPYYCACPNPWIGDFIKEWEMQKPPKDDLFHYVREPFAADISEGKGDFIYNAHSYHTKVPHKAIMRYILHYTAPGDILSDMFCGSGMTGIAGIMCGDIKTIRELGYHVDEKGNIYDPENPQQPFSKVGVRHVVLNDLSPIASFIASGYNAPVLTDDFSAKSQEVYDNVQCECDWMYRTQGANGESGTIDYVIWSDVFICSNCLNEVVYWDAAVDRENAVVADKFACPHCGNMLNKASSQRAQEHTFDIILQRPVSQAKQVPVLIVYTCNRIRYEKTPDPQDIDLLTQIENTPFATTPPAFELPDGFNTTQPKISHGFTHTHHFYTNRNLHILSSFWQKLSNSTKMIFTSFLDNHANKRNRYLLDKHHTMGTTGGPFTGTLYMPPLFCEVNIFKVFEKTKKKYIKALNERDFQKYNNIISVHSSLKSSIPDNSLDYIFVDPPFGANIMYSDLNFLWESWIKIRTNFETEAIVNDKQAKALSDYRSIMLQCFSEAHRILKPGRWMTVEFSNTSAAVWNSIQSALTDAGFIVANVSILDKKHGGIKSMTYSVSVKQDLIISAYKPNGGFEDRFITEVNSEEGVWDFVRTHLKYLPVAKIKGGKLVTVSERDPRLLFDQVVAYYVRKGYNVPISSQDFQEGLAQRFDERDGMYFLNSQVAEYDKKKATAAPSEQAELFVSDEASAIAWLRYQLKQRTMTFQEINPLFMQELAGWSKHEVQLELSELLEQNFLCYDGKGEVPSQIHTYLSTNWHDLRDLAKDDPKLVAKAENRWYVPDPNKAGDLEKLRDKALLKEFEQYRSATKKLKTFRLEAVRAGFKYAYQNRDYATILSVGKRLPEAIIEEDPKLLMWYTQAELRAEG